MFLKKAFAAIFLVLFLISGIAMAQIRITPLPQERSKTESARLKELPPMKLPFWDDFSMSKNLVDTLWNNINGVTVNNFIGIDAPSINVASFNGVDASGKPYSNISAFGKTDSLESRAINLSLLTEPQKSSLYFSFFWQAKGLGDKPNPTDSLRVQFKSNKNKWYTQWVMVNDDAKKESRFNQEILKVKNDGFSIDETFFHENFQFKFQSFGNQGGDYDNWHIDYIYLNHGRHSLDTVYQDETLTTSPTSLFKPYYAVPLRSFIAHPDSFLAKPRVQYRNLSSKGGISTELRAVVNVLKDNQYVTIDSIRKVWTLNPLVAEGEIRWIDSINAVNPSKITAFEDSTKLTLETKVYLKTAELQRFKINDTVRAYTTLHDFYAYDDGTAEASLGIDRQGGRVAYMFLINGRDTLTDVDVYFPNFSNSSSSSTIKIQIWDRLNSTNPLYQDTYPVQSSSGLNEFKRYKLARPIFVKDTFYVGYEQNVNKFISVGYDRNTDSSDKLFYYIDLNQGWQPYNDNNNPSSNTIPGSMMIRPVFGPNDITGIPWKGNSPELKIYPNPSTGVFNIGGDLVNPKIKVYDAFGRMILNTTSLIIDLKNYAAGVYYITVETKKGVFSRKILLK